MKVRDLCLMLAELDEDDEVGYSDGQGGYSVATTAVFQTDPHEPGCDCGCAALILTDE